MVCNILELNASDHLGYEMKPILYRLSDLSTTFQFLSFPSYTTEFIRFITKIGINERRCYFVRKFSCMADRPLLCSTGQLNAILPKRVSLT